jgi:hypothetical protein
MRELAADPCHQRIVRERQPTAAASRAETATEETLLRAEFRRAGIAVRSVWDLVNTSSPYQELYTVLLRHLTLSHHPRIREGIVRALTVKDAGEDVERALLREFQSETEPQLRWALANTLTTAMPYHRRKKHPEIRRVFRRNAEA